MADRPDYETQRDAWKATLEKVANQLAYLLAFLDPTKLGELSRTTSLLYSSTERRAYDLAVLRREKMGLLDSPEVPGAEIHVIRGLVAKVIELESRSAQIAIFGDVPREDLP